MPNAHNGTEPDAAAPLPAPSRLASAITSPRISAKAEAII